MPRDEKQTRIDLINPALYRCGSYKNKQWLRQFPERTGMVLVSIARQFEKGGIEELETTNLFDEAEVVAGGGFDALVGLKVAPEILIQETKKRLLT